MPDDLGPLYEYTTELLRGICRRPFRLAHLTSTSGEIFLRAKLDPADLDELAYADAYPGMRAVLARWGELQVDAAGQPLRIRFNFYDPRNEGLAFGRAVTPAAAGGVGATPPGFRRAGGKPRRRRSGG